MKTLFRNTAVWIIIIFLLSAVFRLSNLDLIEFKSDEAITVYQTVQFFNHPYLITRGLISGTGVYNFPLFNYMMIPIALWSRDPQILSGIIALINSLLVVLFFLMVKKYYGKLTAVFACLLLAFSPWSVLFSRKIWAQDLINLLLIPFLYLLHELILKKNHKVVLPLFLLLTLLIQLHGSGLFLAATTILIFVISRIHLNYKNALIGVLIGLIPILPYVLFQISSYPQCPDCQSFLKYQQSFRIFDFNNFLRPFQITSGLGYHFILGKSYADFISVFPLNNLFKIVFASGFLVILTGILFVLIKKIKYLFLAIYFAVIPFFYFITKTPAYMHYFVMMIPVSVLLFAIAIQSTYSFVKAKFLKISVVVYFLIFLISNVNFLTYFYRFVENKKYIEGDYGPVYSVTKSFIEKETSDYRNLPYYNQLAGFAYIYAELPSLHSKLGEFFLEKGNLELAAKEFKK